MNTDLVRTKLETLRRCVARLREKTPATVEGFVHDVDAQDIICINLERAVHRCVDTAAHILSDYDEPAPQAMAETFRILRRRGVLTGDVAQRMIKAVGFRNIAVHEYANLDWQIVYTVLTKHLDDFVAFAREIGNYMQRRGNSDHSRAL